MIVSNTRYHASEEKRNSYRVREKYTRSDCHIMANLHLDEVQPIQM